MYIKTNLDDGECGCGMWNAESVKDIPFIFRIPIDKSREKSSKVFSAQSHYGKNSSKNERAVSLEEKAQINKHSRADEKKRDKNSISNEDDPVH